MVGTQLMVAILIVSSSSKQCRYHGREPKFAYLQALRAECDVYLYLYICMYVCVYVHICIYISCKEERLEMVKYISLV